MMLLIKFNQHADENIDSVVKTVMKQVLQLNLIFPFDKRRIMEISWMGFDELSVDIEDRDQI